MCAALLALLIAPGQAGAESAAPKGFGASPPNSRGSTAAEKVFVYPEQLLPYSERDSSTILIDARAAESYQQFHLPDSINIPLGFIKTKKFLAGKSVVLVDNGFALSSLLKARSELIEHGFSKVYILVGGIVGWLRSGGEIDGDLIAAALSSQVTPMQLYLEAGRDDLVAIDVSGPGKVDSLDNRLNLRQVSFKPAAVGDFRARIAELITSRSATGGSILIISDSGEWYDTIDKVLKGLPADVFYLTGGKDAYRAYLENEDKLVHRATQKLGERTCPVCPR
jgi:rhodanese-related sulfurtransferase